jgi:hypothetical protein
MYFHSSFHLFRNFGFTVLQIGQAHIEVIYGHKEQDATFWCVRVTIFTVETQQCVLCVWLSYISLSTVS